MRPSWVYWIPAAATAALIFFLSHQSQIPGAPMVWDKAAHFLEYGFFTLTLAFGFTQGFAPDRRTLWPMVAAVLVASLYGVSDEFHQSFVGRDATAADWLADTTGAVFMALALVAAFRWMAGSRAPV